MKFSFKEKDPQAINDKIIEALGGRELGKMVNFNLEGKSLVVTISKLGTSTLVFKHAVKNDELQFSLESEKIAFTHKAFKDDVKDKLCSVIEKVGGKILEK